MTQPKTSIIVPVYNVEPYITECIQSVLRQTYKGSIECILVDDCGTDKSIEIAEKLIAEYEGPIEFRVLHHEKNLGISCARNTGIEAANGDYIYFLDSDDVITDDCLDILTSQLEKGDFDIVVGNNDCFGNRTGGEMLIPDEGLEISGVSFFLKYLDGHQVQGAVWNKLYKHEYLKKNNLLFEPGLVLEDHVYNFRLSCYLTKMCVIKKITYHYRSLREGSIDCELIGNPEALRDRWVQVWICIRNYCEKDKYNEVHELALYTYGKRIFVMSRENNFDYKEIFVNLSESYPYNPLKIWLSGRKGFKWFFSRLIWVFPPLIAFYYYETKCRIKDKLSNVPKR